MESRSAQAADVFRVINVDEGKARHPAWFTDLELLRQMRNFSPTIALPGLVALLAFLYLASGAMGTQLAVPPGYATIVWPPSGISLAALLFFGSSLWPGVLLGSFVLNLAIGGVFTGGASTISVAVAAAIAMGSSVQAVVGYYICRRFFGVPVGFQRWTGPIVMLLAAGPFTCVIAASVGVAALYFGNAIPASEIATNWLTWWIGDTLGVLIFLPIGLLGPWRRWTPHWQGKPIGGFTAITLTMLLVPVAASFYAWKVTSEISYERQRADFNTLAHDNEIALRHRLDSYKQSLDGGAGLFRASDRVTRQEWERYVDALKISENLPGINGIGFIVPATGDDPAAVAEEFEFDGVDGVEIHPTGDVFDHFIIKYIEPLHANREALGLNIAFEMNRFDAAVNARDTGRATITKRITLVQDATASHGFLLLRPLYSAGSDPDSLSSRRANFTGWVYAPFIAPVFMRDLTSGQGMSFNLQVHDGPDADPESLIYSSAGADTIVEGDFKAQRTFSIMEQEWTLVWTSTPQFDASVADREPALVLAGGLLLSALLGGLLLIVSRREETIRNKVEQKTRELAAREDENQSIVQTAVVAILLLDEQGDIISANSAASKIFGYLPEEMDGHTIADFLPGLDWTDASSEFGDFVSARSRDGGVLSLAVQMNPWTSESGYNRYTVIIRDVTAEVIAKKELQQTEQRWKHALEGADLGVFDVDLVSGTSQVSPRWKTMLGFAEDEDIDAQREWIERVHPDDMARVREADQACVEGRTRRSEIEYRIRRTDGTWIWVRSDAGVTERDARGAAMRLVGTQTEITALREARDALVASEERFRTAIEDAPVGMAMLTRDREWIKVNDALCRLLGYQDDELLEVDPFSLIHPDDIQLEATERANRLIQGKISAYQREIRLRHREGHYLWVLMFISAARDPDTGERYFINMFQDITDQKEMERLKTEFVSMVSHELRTPLTSIRGSLGLVLGAMAEEVPERALNMLSIARNNCERLVLLVNDILDLEKVSSGNMRFDMRLEGTQRLIRQGLAENQGYADQLDVEQRLGSLADVDVTVDHGRFLQVLANLLSNAAKFSPAGGTITVESRRIGDRVRICVSDEGPGIDPSFRGKIFERFSQADASATRAKNGSGLGLAISKMIVEQMNGTIGFDSEFGAGSTFWFELPIAAEDDGTNRSETSFSSSQDQVRRA